MVMIMMMSTIMFITLKHPLSMGLNLMIQIIIIMVMTGNMINFWWFSYIAFLVMIGGMMILFIYMTSIASNEMFKLNYKTPLIIILISFINTIFIDSKLNINESMMMNNSTLNISKFFCFPSNFLMMLLIIYLFITLIAVVKIINKKTGSLRSN